MPVGENHIVRFGPYQLDTQCGQLRKNGFGVKLQGQPVQILEILLEKPGELVTREELRQRLWSTDTFVDFDHSLNTAIKRLRQALGDEAESPRYIETIPKRGYRFIAQVTPQKGENGDAVSSLAPAEIATISPATLTQEERRTDKGTTSSRIWWILSLSVLCAVAVGFGVYWATQPEPMPHIAGWRALTKSSFWKGNFPQTDGRFVYFLESHPSGLVLMRVPTEGGETSELPNAIGAPRDISPDGTRLLTADSTGLWSVPIPVGEPRLIVRDARFAVWSADGRSVFFSRNNDKDLYAVDAEGTNIRLLAHLPDISWPQRSPDGERLRFSVEPNVDLWEINTDGSNPHPILPGYKYVGGGTWSPDGRYYFFTYWDGQRNSLFVTSGQKVAPKKSASRPERLTFGPLSVGIPVISRDGRQLYAKAEEHRGELSVYDSKSEQFIPFLSGLSICYVDFSRDGQWMAYVSYPEGTLWRSRIDGSERLQLTTPPISVMNPRWSPDGKSIAFTDVWNGIGGSNGPPSSRIYVVDANGGGPLLLVSGRASDPAWSADGAVIAYADDAPSTFEPNRPVGIIKMIDLKTLHPAVIEGSQNIWSPRWSPDGRYLVALAGALPVKRLVLFNFAQHHWEELATGAGFAWPCWSRDSRFVYARDGTSFVRISVSDHKREQLLSLAGFRSTAFYVDRWNEGWMGLAPNDRPITTRDLGTSQIYAFDLEYK